MRILHLIEKGEQLRQAFDGYLEVAVTDLNAEEQEADYVALHKQKTQRSWKGGRILGLRVANEEELAGLSFAASAEQAGIVVQFDPIRSYNGRPGVPWSGGRSSSASKSLEEIAD